MIPDGLRGARNGIPLLIAPHNDDECLFASFLLLRYQPWVVIAYEGSKQPEIPPAVRTRETVQACSLLGATGITQWELPDSAPAATAAHVFEGLLAEYETFIPHVFAPAIEDGGHEQHNLVGQVALDVFGADRVTQYLTYRRGSMRTRSEWEIPFDPLWPSYKLAAMACYQSQIATPNTLPWFIDDCLREWYAHEPSPIVQEEGEDVEAFMQRNALRWATDAALKECL